MRLSVEEVVEYCKVVPITMLDGLEYCPHGDDCASCQSCTFNFNEGDIHGSCL